MSYSITHIHVFGQQSLVQGEEEGRRDEGGRR